MDAGIINHDTLVCRRLDGLYRRVQHILHIQVHVGHLVRSTIIEVLAGVKATRGFCRAFDFVVEIFKLISTLIAVRENQAEFADILKVQLHTDHLWTDKPLAPQLQMHALTQLQLVFERFKLLLIKKI